jgi:PST family polysaccharide transporter
VKKISLRKVSINVVSSFITQISNYVFPFITVPYFSRLVGPDKYGTVNFIAAFIGYFLLLINFGFDVTATRDIVQFKENKRAVSQVSSEVFLSRLFLCTISGAAFSMAIVFIPQLRSELFVSVSSFLTCLAIAVTPSFVFNGYQDNYRLAIFNIVSKVFFTLGVFILIRQRSDYILYPLLLSLAQLMVGAISLYYYYHVYGLQFLSTTIDAIKARIVKSKSFFYSLIIISVYTSANTIIIGFIEGEVEAGYFSAALKIMTVLQLCLSMPFAEALFPYFSEKFKHGRPEGLEAVTKAFPGVMLLSVAAALTLCAISPLIIRVVFGSAFEPSVSMLRVLSFIPLVVIYNQFIGIHIFMNLHLDSLFKRTLAYGAVVGLPLNLLGGYLGGGFGISITYLLTELFLAFIFTSYMNKQGISFSSLLKYANWIAIENVYRMIVQIGKQFKV